MKDLRISNTAQRLREIMDQRGLRQRDLVAMVAPYCEKYGVTITKSHISLYVNGKVEPNQWKLLVLGQALGVSEAWLMGFDVPMEKKAAPPVDYVVKNGDAELLVEVQDLNSAQKNLLRDYIALLKKTN